jgi:hypothetical protein
MRRISVKKFAPADVSKYPATARSFNLSLSWAMLNVHWPQYFYVDDLKYLQHPLVPWRTNLSENLRSLDPSDLKKLRPMYVRLFRFWLFSMSHNDIFQI